MTHTVAQTKTCPLSYAERAIIASVITWDNCQSHSYSPDEIEAIRIDHDIAWVKLSQDRSYPIAVFMFRSILEAQREAINKQIDAVIEVEAAAVAEAEREMSEIIHASVQQEFNNWVASGCCPAYLESLPGDLVAELLPPAENGYHDPFWTAEGCEF